LGKGRRAWGERNERAERSKENIRTSKRNIPLSKKGLPIKNRVDRREGEEREPKGGKRGKEGTGLSVRQTKSIPWGGRKSTEWEPRQQEGRNFE